MRDLTVPSGRSQLVGDFLIRELLQVAQHDRLPQRGRQLGQRLADAVPQVELLELAVRAALARDRHQLRRVHVARHRLAFLADAAVVVDAEVAADADQPGLEVRAPVERVQRLEDLQEDVLRQVLGLVVPADELVGEVEDLAPVLPDDLVPGRPDRPRGTARSARRYCGDDATGWSTGHQRTASMPGTATGPIIANCA